MRLWVEKFLLVAAGVIVALIMCEVGLHLAGIEYPFFYDYDPVIGVRLRPGIRGYYLKEGGGYVSINSDGLRDREHALKKPPKTIRIAVLGDSFVEAMQVNQQEAFWSILAKELQQCEGLRGRRIEVIDFGISGLGTAQELLVLQNHVWKYSPDIVLLAFTTANDVSDNSRALKQVDYNPYYVYRDNKLVLENQQTRATWLAEQNNLIRQAIFHWGIDRLRLLQVLYHAKEVLQEWWAQHDVGRRIGASGPGQEAGLSDMIYKAPTTRIWQDAWRVTEGVLVQMRDEVTRHGARFFMVTLTNGIQVNPNPAVRQAYAQALGVPDLFYPDRRLAGFCQEHHIPVLLLAPSFQEYATRHQVYLHGFGKSLGKGHWNQQGHRLAGETIARWLCPQLSDPGRSGHQGAS
uniref:SGNH/GDSL hydrolase family protein n=1 Tax=Desulfobacca acetoxidans TaxID=60893 RepID=A0A7V6DPP9_9BACT